MSPFASQLADYESLTDSQCFEQIQNIRREQGNRLLILAHHYQRGLITELADYIGDSFGLAKNAQLHATAKDIVFCGVRFMAESAAILARPDQRVFHPDPEAGCPMADMAPMDEVQAAWQDLTSRTSDSIIPITYMNSHAPLKAFVGKNNGVVCTSSNAPKTFEWGFQQGQKLFFFPDQHLGRNTGRKYGFTDSEMVVYSPSKPKGGISESELAQAKVILWNGHCPVHMEFTVNDINRFRRQFPGCKILVHPECTEAVLQAADAAGSTHFIDEYVKNAQAGDIIFIGTEISMVNRLALTYTDRKIFRLHRSLCPTMYMINMPNLYFALDHLETIQPVEISEDEKYFANKALSRMLSLQ
jgi:quinolinate synthase